MVDQISKWVFLFKFCYNCFIIGSNTYGGTHICICICFVALAVAVADFEVTFFTFLCVIISKTNIELGPVNYWDFFSIQSNNNNKTWFLFKTLTVCYNVLNRDSLSSRYQICLFHARPDSNLQFNICKYAQIVCYSKISNLSLKSPQNTTLRYYYWKSFISFVTSAIICLICNMHKNVCHLIACVASYLIVCDKTDVSKWVDTCNPLR